MILAIDTATRLLSIALHNGDTLLAEHAWNTANQHSVELSPAIEDMLNKARITAQDLQTIAIAQGPGSFTGLRIGMSVAKSMAFALNIPLVAVPTFEIVAYNTSYFKGSLYVSVAAGRGRIHAQRFRWQKGGWIPAGEPINLTWEELVVLLDKATLISGEIDEQGFSVLENVGSTIEVALPSQRLRRAGYLAEIAWRRIDSGQELTDPNLIVPIYLKTP